MTPEISNIRETLEDSTENSKSLASLCTVGTLVVAHWAIYWLMNGLDKFLNRTDLGLFAWYGKDRTTQFGTYLERTAMPETLLSPLLYFTAIVEFIVFVPLGMVIYSLAIKGTVVRRTFELGFVGSIVIYMGFSFFDVIFGDRAELLEHGTFLIGVLLSYKIALDEYERRGLFK